MSEPVCFQLFDKEDGLAGNWQPTAYRLISRCRILSFDGENDSLAVPLSAALRCSCISELRSNRMQIYSVICDACDLALPLANRYTIIQQELAVNCSRRSSFEYGAGLSFRRRSIAGTELQL
jgi:hypothetical protein